MNERFEFNDMFGVIEGEKEASQIPFPKSEPPQDQENDLGNEAK